MSPWTIKRQNLSDVITESGALDASARLQVYSQAYQGRLVECLGSEYPVLRHAMGDELFSRFATDYLITQPSSSYTLNDLGDRFPQYLLATRPIEDANAIWADFLIELATLERFFSEVFHASGTEDNGINDAADTQSILLETSTRWMKSSFPIDDYLISTRQHLSDPDTFPFTDFPQPEDIAILVFRRDYVVRLRRMSPADVPAT